MYSRTLGREVKIRNRGQQEAYKSAALTINTALCRRVGIEASKVNYKVLLGMSPKKVESKHREEQIKVTRSRTVFQKLKVEVNVDIL